MKTICNPLDLSYRYQQICENGKAVSFREGADPTLIRFQDRYYLFVSMSAGFWYSDNLADWKFHSDPDLLIYDYAPDVRQIGPYLYFCASRRGRNCPILRTKDPLHEPFEEVSAPFAFWDPDLFQDDDGRVYLYWGCGNTDPIYGVEMDPETMTPVGEKRELIFPQEKALGYERPGENGIVEPKEKSPLYQMLHRFENPETGELELPENLPAGGGFTREKLKKMYASFGKPYIEGAFMTKHAGRYYLQYACPATEYNTYSDGVYVGEHPLGPFVLQRDNPFSSKPGGFITGAGHGSTIKDAYGNWWHASTMRISVNHAMERRVGLFPAGFSEDGTLYCSQAFGDYPLEIPDHRMSPEKIGPKWMLLNYHSPVLVSSTEEGSDPARAVDEDIRTWWSAGTALSGEWIVTDLAGEKDVRAVQISFADEDLSLPFPKESYGDDRGVRRIECSEKPSHFLLEESRDGIHWNRIEEVYRECANAYFEIPEGIRTRYLRLTAQSLPYGQRLRVSGFRVFGNGEGEKPARAEAGAVRTGALDARVYWKKDAHATGHCVYYGIRKDHLFHSWMVYGASEVTLSTLLRGEAYFVRVDSFNENGITEGEVFFLAAEPEET